MKVLWRWGKFNLVGAVGMAVQLGVLALINRLAPGHYLLATAAALEITLLHNFVWHVRYTWRDRFPTLNVKGAFRMGNAGMRAALAGQLVRFHLSNGAVSMAGNLALMPALVEGARLPVVPANAIAIVSCSIVNFLLGDQWAFASARVLHEEPAQMARQDHEEDPTHSSVADKGALLELGHGLAQFGLGVHHDGAVPCHRLLERLTRDEQKANALGASLDHDLVAAVEEHE